MPAPIISSFEKYLLRQLDGLPQQRGSPVRVVGLKVSVPETGVSRKWNAGSKVGYTDNSLLALQFVGPLPMVEAACTLTEQVLAERENWPGIFRNTEDGGQPGAYVVVHLDLSRYTCERDKYLGGDKEKPSTFRAEMLYELAIGGMIEVKSVREH